MLQRIKNNLAWVLGVVVLSYGCAQPEATQEVAQEEVKSKVGSEVIDGVLYQNGEAIFPFGMYFEWAGTTENHLKGLEDMAQLGFNYSFITLGQEGISFEDHKKIYDKAAELNIPLIAEKIHYQFPNGLTAVEAFKDHPGVGGWSAGDDVMGHTAKYVYDNVQWLKERDPNHMYYISSNGTQRSNIDIKIEDFAHTGIDAIAVQAYPIPFERHWFVYEPGAKDIRMVYYRNNRMVQYYEDLGILPFANNQAFQWWFEENERYPTGEEAEVMIYQTIIAGVKGFLAYTYQACCPGTKNYVPGKSIFDEAPDLKPAYVNANREIQALKDVLLFGKRTTLTVDPTTEWVFAAYWEYEGRTYVIATNTSAEPQKAIIPLAGFPLSGTVKNVFEDRKGNLKIAEGMLTGEMEPMSTHIYEIVL